MSNLRELAAQLTDPALAAGAARRLSRTTFVFDTFDEVSALASAGHGHAESVLRAWAAAEWFTERPPVAAVLERTVFRVPGEITTDDLSPATEAWSRTDVPRHALSMLRAPRPGLEDALARLAELKALGRPVAFAGDVVGTGSSRKSAASSLVWHIGAAGVVLARRIAPIFSDTLRDAGALPIECDVSALRMGEVIRVYVHEGRIEDASGGTVARFTLRSDTQLDEVRAGGRLALVAGRALTARARAALGLGPTEVFAAPRRPPRSARFTLAQKMVGHACGLEGVAPGTYCEPRASTVGSQDTTGPMTRDALDELGCERFAADLVLQTFCHTVAYPRPGDVQLARTLPAQMVRRGGVSLRPGDGIIHKWLNRMLLPDQVGTGADSHTRFPLGISFPAGSGLVAFAAATGVMPLEMPESVLVRFSGRRRPGITVRDLVHAIPHAALARGLLTVPKSGKVNVFSGRVLELEGLDELSVDEAFELTDATAERSAAACTIALSEASVAAHLTDSIALLEHMLAEGYEDQSALVRRARAMEAWLEAPALLRADRGAEYAAVIEIDLAELREPLLACPNDPDDVRPLSAVAGAPIDEVFIGSCMTRLPHFQAAARVLEAGPGPAPARVWIAPPTRFDRDALLAEGAYVAYARAGARTEVPGCSLCMGNQARVAPGARVVSTSTRNFPNRLGDGASVYLASAELAAIAAVLGRLPTPEEYGERVDASG